MCDMNMFHLVLSYGTWHYLWNRALTVDFVYKLKLNTREKVQLCIDVFQTHFLKENMYNNENFVYDNLSVLLTN